MIKLRLRVATIKKASCAGLRLQTAFGLQSCKCGKSKKVASHALKNTYNNTGIATGVIIIEWNSVHICLSK